MQDENVIAQAGRLFSLGQIEIKAGDAQHQALAEGPETERALARDGEVQQTAALPWID